MIWLRLLRTILRSIFRGLRPIDASLASIAADLRTLTRIQLLRLGNEGFTLPDEQLMRHPKDSDLTEVSWDVRDPGGQQFDADDEGILGVDLQSFFRK